MDLAQIPVVHPELQHRGTYCPGFSGRLRFRCTPPGRVDTRSPQHPGNGSCQPDLCDGEPFSGRACGQACPRPEFCPVRGLRVPDPLPGFHSAIDGVCYSLDLADEPIRCAAEWPYPVPSFPCPSGASTAAPITGNENHPPPDRAACERRLTYSAVYSRWSSL